MKYLIFLIVLVLPTYLVRFSIFGIPTTLLEIIIYLAFAAGLTFFIKQKRSLSEKKAWIPVAIVLGGATISAVISPLRLVAFGELKAFFIDPLLVFWLVLVYFKPRDFKLLFAGLALSSIFVSLQAIWQYANHVLTPDGRVVGIFGYSPNYLALFLAPITVLVIGYAIESWLKDWRNNIGNLGIILFDMFAIYLSGSRAGLLVVAAGLISFLILKYWSKIKTIAWLKIVIAVLIIASIAAAWFVFKPNFTLSPSVGGRTTSSNNIRWQIWQTSLEIGTKNPILGIGLGNFQNYFTELTQTRVNFPEFISPWALTPHNLYLMFWLSTGLLGFAGFIWILIIFFKKGFEVRDSTSVILMAAMITLLVQGLVDTPYFKNDLSLIFWLIIGGMLILKKGEK